MRLLSSGVSATAGRAADRDKCDRDRLLPSCRCRSIADETRIVADMAFIFAIQSQRCVGM